MTATRSPVDTSPGSKVTVAFSVARLTLALSTPSALPMARSTLATQLAQVMPVTGSSTVVSWSLIGVSVVVRGVTSLQSLAGCVPELKPMIPLGVYRERPRARPV